VPCKPGGEILTTNNERDAVSSGEAFKQNRRWRYPSGRLPPG
jgi:hypothetical protein